MSTGPAVRSTGAPHLRGDEIAPDYEVIEHLRRGNDLDVYDVWSAERGARCIVKALRPDRDRSRARHSLLREGALLERLTHPHIVRAYETLTDPSPMVVIETLTGTTLAVEIADEPPPDTADVAQLGLQLGSAVRYLHRHGHLHLDLKPSNVIVEAGRARLIDLSLARPPGPAHAGVGSYHYLAPEQARGGLLTEAADVWGLGAVLFEAASGEAPFDDDPDAFASVSPGSGTLSDAAPERYPQLERRARTVRSVRAALAPRVGELIDACLEPAAADRPPIGELLAGLEALAGLPGAELRWTRQLRRR